MIGFHFSHINTLFYLSLHRKPFSPLKSHSQDSNTAAPKMLTATAPNCQ